MIAPSANAWEALLQPEELARRLLTVRRQRDERFGAELFGEPAWELLLHLFVAGRDGKPQTVGDAARAIETPNMLVVRWLDALEDRSIVVRSGGKVRLSESGTEAVLMILDASELCARPANKS